MIYDHGMNPKDADADVLAVNSACVRRELGCIMYASNVLGSRGPRKMKVCVPAVSPDGVAREFRPLRKRDEMLTRVKENDFDG